MLISNNDYTFRRFISIQSNKLDENKKKKINKIESVADILLFLLLLFLLLLLLLLLLINKLSYTFFA
jgi:hypothetical protein